MADWATTHFTGSVHGGVVKEPVYLQGRAGDSLRYHHWHDRAESFRLVGSNVCSLAG